MFSIQSTIHLRKLSSRELLRNINQSLLFCDFAAQKENKRMRERALTRAFVSYKTKSLVRRDVYVYRAIISTVSSCSHNKRLNFPNNAIKHQFMLRNVFKNKINCDKFKVSIFIKSSFSVQPEHLLTSSETLLF